MARKTSSPILWLRVKEDTHEEVYNIKRYHDQPFITISVRVNAYSSRSSTVLHITGSYNTSKRLTIIILILTEAKFDFIMGRS